MFRLRVWAMCCVAMIGITTMTGCTCDAFVLEEINGVITDDTGAAVGNAIVRIQSGLAFDDEEVVTREDGSFEHIGFLGLGPCVIGTLPKPFIGTIFVAVTKDGQQGSATIDVTQAQQTLRPNRRIIDLGQITIALQ